MLISIKAGTFGIHKFNKTKTMLKKVKSPAKKEIKEPAKKAPKSAVTKVKTAAKKEAKKPEAKVKTITQNAPKAAVKVKTKTRAARKAKTAVKQRIVPQIVIHGKDQHFIPDHSKKGLEIIHDGKKEEQLFHGKEEVALHQENQKVKAGMLTKSNIKRIFNSQGRR